MSEQDELIHRLLNLATSDPERAHAEADDLDPGLPARRSPAGIRPGDGPLCMVRHGMTDVSTGPRLHFGTHGGDALFALPSDAFKVTSDDCYTPRWVFDAMGLQFDLDVAAPPGGPWHVPAKRWYTAEDDGLAQPWDGLVWCNPPYSNFIPWAQRWATHRTGVLMGLASARSRGRMLALRHSDAVAFVDVQFEREGQPLRVPSVIFVACRGIGTEPAERLADADPRGAVLYGKAAA